MTGIIEATVHASVKELAYMNRISFSTSSQNSIFDTDDPKSSCTSHETLLSVGSKRKIPRESENSGPGKPDGSKLMVITDSSTCTRDGKKNAKCRYFCRQGNAAKEEEQHIKIHARRNFHERTKNRKRIREKFIKEDGDKQTAKRKEKGVRRSQEF